MLDLRVGLTLHVLDHAEPSGLKLARHVRGLEHERVHVHRLPPPLIEVQWRVADVERQQQFPSRRQTRRSSHRVVTISAGSMWMSE